MATEYRIHEVLRDPIENNGEKHVAIYVITFRVFPLTQSEKKRKYICHIKLGSLKVLMHSNTRLLTVFDKVSKAYFKLYFFFSEQKHSSFFLWKIFMNDPIEELIEC